MQGTAAARPAPRAGAAGRWWGALGPTGGAVAALVVLVAANALFTPNFATASNLWNVLSQVSVTLLVAVGMTYVIATAGVDLSVGSVMAISAAVAAVTLDYGLLVAIPLALLAAVAVGLLNGAFISYFKVQAIVVTLATLLAGRGLAQIINRDGALISIGDPGFLVLGRGLIGPMPVQVLIAAVVVALAVFVLRSTPFGRYVLAAGGNPAAARLAGVPVNRTVISVYAISGLLAGLAGLVEASRLGASAAARIGVGAELDAIAAVVVGGTLLSGGRATLMGTVVGALIMQVIATSFNMLLIPYPWAQAFKAVIILFAVYLQRPRRV
ncbi:MAG TPA: ABC transporter permease [Longimicrobium sp.]|nr:ABC transporter permease [Longimicrobium sp.]